MMRSLLIAGALLAAAGVVLGAFGAHALKGKLDAGMLGAWQTGVQYHLVHALGIVALALAGLHWPGNTAWLAWPAWLMFAGIVLFSGSLYAMALTDVRWLGAITPLGGVAFIAAWLLLAWAASRLPPGA